MLKPHDEALMGRFTISKFHRHEASSYFVITQYDTCSGMLCFNSWMVVGEEFNLITLLCGIK
jgi:hypothetical protein